ncbi:unnamed protein product [Hymenolepis diminuta]|uniref:Uncharacterized protein n=1 Tax=Hymenolepis diminuta TaxID=6216 RepID=A0A564YIG3_HYMDI|nr:unnamed protein product [Hymenolepis diminuta]
MNNVPSSLPRYLKMFGKMSHIDVPQFSCIVPRHATLHHTMPSTFLTSTGVLGVLGEWVNRVLTMLFPPLRGSQFISILFIQQFLSNFTSESCGDLQKSCNF